MHRKDEHGVGDFEDAFSPVPHASGFRLILALATQHNMHCDHVDISQALVQMCVYACKKGSKPWC